jgi:CrcB protein
MTTDERPGMPPAPDPVDAAPPPRRGRRPLHVRPLLWAVVAAGGLVGTATRELASRALPHTAGGWPTATFAVNVAGAFLLGVLLEALVRGGPDGGWRRITRFGLGTGLCGALTTYSSLAVEVDLLARGGHWPTAVGYAAASVCAGLAATTVGILMSARWHRRRRRAPAAIASQSASW